MGISKPSFAEASEDKSEGKKASTFAPSFAKASESKKDSVDKSAVKKAS